MLLSSNHWGLRQVSIKKLLIGFKISQRQKRGAFSSLSNLSNFLAIRERTERDAVIGEVLTDQIYCDLRSVHNISSIQSYLVQKKKPPAKKGQLCQRSYQLIPTKFH